MTIQASFFIFNSLQSKFHDYQAIANLNNAILLNPKDPSTFTILAIAYCNKKDYDNALANINKAVLINENRIVSI